MCIAQVICPVGAPFCARARRREGHPCQVAQPATPHNVCWRTSRRDHTLCPWDPDIIPLPPSGCLTRVPSIVCLPRQEAISVGCALVTVLAGALRTCTGCLPQGVYATHHAQARARSS